MNPNPKRKTLLENNFVFIKFFRTINKEMTNGTTRNKVVYFVDIAIAMNMPKIV